MLNDVDDPKAIVRRGYDRVSRAYRADDAEDGQYGSWLELVEQRVGPGSSVLDLGCGCGVPVARRLANRYVVTGVDLSPVQIERARGLVPDATFVCADMAHVDFPAASFDAIVCFYALIHLPLAEQPAILRSIANWLRPGGIFMATVGHGAWTGIQKDWLGVEGGDMWWSHADTATYRRWLSDAGLTVEREAFVPEGNGGHTLVVASRPSLSSRFIADALVDSWRAEEAATFAGWDFSHLRGRWHEESPPWSYEDLARGVLRGARSAVDLGTGGGERLSRLADAFPPQMFATEGYAPNVALARERLVPLGVTVLEYRSEHVSGGVLPFADGSLDAVLDRHESYDAREVARVLAPGGRLLTQQVDGRSQADLIELFGAAPQFPEVELERFVVDARRAGLRVERAEQWWGDSVFADVGALVYYLKAVPWLVPDFSVARYEPVLRELHERVGREGVLRFRAARFLLLAQRDSSQAAS